MKYIFTISIILSLCSCSNSSTENISNEKTNNDTIVVDTFQSLTNRITEFPKVAQNWADRAEYFFQIGNLNDARIDYEQAILLDSLNPNFRVKYGNILIGYLELQGAKYNFEYALKYDSLNADAFVGLGKVYAFIDNPGMATVYLNKAYKINPYLPEAYFLEGLIYRSDYEQTRRPESWTRAKSSFQTAIEQNPRMYDAYIMLGIMNDTEDNDLALDYYNSALAIAPESTEAWYNKGMHYQKKEKYEQARYCYRKITGLDSTYNNANYNQGFLYLVKEPNYDSAIYFYNKVIAIDSLSDRGYNDLGLAYELKGDNDKAIQFYEMALAINPDFEKAKKNLRIVKNK